MNFVWKPFNQLSLEELHELMKLRQQVFVVEQNSIYVDADDWDKQAWHLQVRDNKNDLIACLRVLPKGTRFTEPSFGRVVVAQTHRGTGLGQEISQDAIRKIKTLYGQNPIRISAQSYLKEFYGRLGFAVDSEPYDEDGIPHVEMLKSTAH